MKGLQTGLAYSRCGLTIDKYNCITIGTVEPSVKESNYFRSFEQIVSMCLPNDKSLESRRPRYLKQSTFSIRCMQMAGCIPPDT